jgi:hypothetical protein
MSPPMLARLKAAWAAFIGPPVHECKGCGTSDPKKLAADAVWCIACGMGTPAEREQFARQQSGPVARRRDDPRQ